MKKLYIIARNHMDPSWLRCFTDHFCLPGSRDVVRPYSDIEELQILEYMDFAEKYGVKYQIEQSLVVKKFLERNPDQKERFRSLVEKGFLELAGGGEAVIDYNLTQGESWARDHLYGRKYYEREFGHRPRYAITPDIFGLPSQLPQFFRSIGYDALIIFDRVLKNNKPFWRGLDSTLIVLDSCFLQPPEPNMRTADCVKLPACKACGGNGCALCEGTGLDVTYDMTRPDKELLQSAYYGNMSADVFLETLLATDKDEYFVMITTEEPRIGGFLYGPLREAAPRHGIEVEYLSFEDNHEVWCPGQEQALRNGEFTPDLIDTRPEGNPAACGCYSSRIEIKKANRELEDLLFEAEALSVLGKLNGCWQPESVPRRDYPDKKLEMLWNKMAFIQFHDCVTGSHCDASYNELLRYVREVRRGAYQIYKDAGLTLLDKLNVKTPEGYYSAVYFNPTPYTADFPRLDLHAPRGTKSVELYDSGLKRLPAFDFETVEALAGTGVKCRVRAAVPPFGWRLLLWKASAEEEKKNTAIPDGKALVVENEYYRITVGENCIDGIYDKAGDREMLSKGAGAIALGTDKGSPWGRSEPESDHRQLFADKVLCEYADGFGRIIMSGTVTDEVHKIKKLAWKQTVTLFEGDDKIRFHTELDWDGADTRVFASFPAAFEHGDSVFCEVPFGTMERKQLYSGNCMGITDEWPSLGFAGISDGGYSVAVLKGGFPATRLHDGSLQISLLRAFSCDDPRYGGTNDTGFHTSDYAITSWKGGFGDGCCAARAAVFNTAGLTLAVNGPGVWRETDKENVYDTFGSGSLLPELSGIPRELRLSALKRSEDGSDLIIRLWESTGRQIKFSPGHDIKLIRCNTLEKPLSEEPSEEYLFRPFEIATFIVRIPEKTI